MVTSVCPDLSTDPALVYIDGGYTKFMDLTTRLTDLAINQAYSIQQVQVAPVPFSVSFDFADQLPGFQRPPRPALDASRFEFHSPAEPADAPTFVESTPVLDAAPAFTTADPVLAFRPRPVTPAVAAPVRPNPGPTLVIPTEPDTPLPTLPTFVDLNLPTVPTLNLAEFEGERPQFVEPPLNEDWSWSPQAYTSTLLEKTRAKVAAMMDRQLGDLEPIEAVLFERGRARISVEVRRRIDERMDEFGTRGFSEPNGMLAHAIDMALEDGLNRTGELNQSVTIESYKESLANLRFAVQQGIACEQVTINLHLQTQQLTLAAAQYLRDTGIAILNARVAVFNARLNAYQTDAQVMATRIQSELAKVEVFRAQIEAERLKGEINEQRVKLYAEQIRALNALIEMYRGRVEAVKTQAEIERTRIEGYKADVDAYSARWRAFGDEVQAYKAEVEAEGSKATVHRTLVDAFATKVGAWNTKSNAVFEGERLRIAQHGQRLQAWRGGLDKMLALVQGENARIAGEGARADALARIYTADASIESAVSAAAQRTFELGLARAQANTDVGLKTAEIRIQENIQLSQVLFGIQKSIADVLTQLGASSMSAINFNAGVSSSKSNSRSCDTNFSWSGEIADYG